MTGDVQSYLTIVQILVTIGIFPLINSISGLKKSVNDLQLELYKHFVLKTEFDEEKARVNAKIETHKRAYR